MALLGFALVSCSIAIVLSSCAPCELFADGGAGGGKAQAFRIVVGEGGGFAGTWEGYTIWSDGTVAAWSGRKARENEHEVGKLPPDTLCALWGDAKLLMQTPTVEASGNLVRFLKVTVGDTTRSYSWVPVLGAVRSKATYQGYHDRCIAVIRKAVTPR
jgi:hypothetical protein